MLSMLFSLNFRLRPKLQHSSFIIHAILHFHIKNSDFFMDPNQNFLITMWTRLDKWLTLNQYKLIRKNLKFAQKLTGIHILQHAKS